MIPTINEHKIFSRHLYNQVNWKRLYYDTAAVSKKMFTKEDILGHIKELILKYPSYYDTSSIEGRVESTVSTLEVKVGTINNYYYIISKPMMKHNGEYLSWFLTEESFLDYIERHKKANRYCVVVNIKDCLRHHKINKICTNLKKITNLIPE